MSQQRNASARALALAVLLVPALTSGVLLTAAGGCHWLRWRALARTHVDLIEQLAADAVESMSAPQAGLEPADIERLRYPLARARAFADGQRGRFAQAPWLARFDRLLDAYAGLVDWLDRARVRRTTARDRRRAAVLLARVRSAAEAVRRELAP